MRKTLLILFILLDLDPSFGQRTIKGMVVDIDLLPLPGATISLNDETKLGSTDFNGYFETTLPVETNTLNFYFIGYEPTKVVFTNDCDYLEVIINSTGCYLNMSKRKIDRLRKKELDNLPKIHLEAFRKEIFKFEKPCFRYN